MCKLVNEVVIKGGYFDTNRPLNSCEVNVLFGASETMTSAFEANLIDAAVIVSNNLGTIITNNASSTQGSVKRMTGLFYTSPSTELVKTAQESGIIPVFPYTATIDQIAGVKRTIELGYKDIAVSVAANDNYLHKQLKELEYEYNVKIYKFGLCSTGIDEKTSLVMKDYADVIWSCASKQVKEYIEPASIAQVGIKIPVHVMTVDGWKLIRNHLMHMKSNLNLENIQLTNSEEKPIFLNDESTIKVLSKKNIHKCTDCPHPCI
jgi:putative methanogenesis marker protein 8